MASVQMMADTDALTFSEAEQLNELLTALERALPKRTIVHNMNINGERMSISFSTKTKEEAAKVLMQLKTIPYIQSVDVAGIVEKVENGRVYTIEGNTSDSCRQRSYPVGYYQILGYGIPDY